MLVLIITLSIVISFVQLNPIYFLVALVLLFEKWVSINLLKGLE